MVNHLFLIFFARFTMFIVELDRQLIRKIDCFVFSFGSKILLNRNGTYADTHNRRCIPNGLHINKHIYIATQNQLQKVRTQVEPGPDMRQEICGPSFLQAIQKIHFCPAEVLPTIFFLKEAN